jgi:hypothetical protein
MPSNSNADSGNGDGAGIVAVAVSLGENNVAFKKEVAPQLRRMRLDHGPKRHLLPVPELRHQERLQLTEAAKPGGPAACGVN